MLLRGTGGIAASLLGPGQSGGTLNLSQAVICAVAGFFLVTAPRARITYIMGVIGVATTVMLNLWNIFQQLIQEDSSMLRLVPQFLCVLLLIALFGFYAFGTPSRAYYRLGRWQWSRVLGGMR
jgi:uncharacterized membrane protein